MKEESFSCFHIRRLNLRTPGPSSICRVYSIRSLKSATSFPLNRVVRIRLKGGLNLLRRTLSVLSRPGYLWTVWSPDATAATSSVTLRKIVPRRQPRLSIVLRLNVPYALKWVIGAYGQYSTLLTCLLTTLSVRDCTQPRQKPMDCKNCGESMRYPWLHKAGIHR